MYCVQKKNEQRNRKKHLIEKRGKNILSPTVKQRYRLKP